MMKYMLITVAEREIMTEQFDTFNEARARMMKELCECGNIDPTDCTEEESECNSDFGYCKWNAYVNDGVNHGNYDWRIVKI